MSDLEMKSFGPFEIKSEDRGEVVAIVATLGVVDKDGDVIMPGSFPPDGSRVKLSGYNHDVVIDGAAPVGKGVITEEGDRAVFRGNFFMSTDRGRQAFLHTKEMGTEGEWSFGFPKAVKTGDMTDDWRAKGAKRVIAGLTPIEASPVFVGAGWGTGTLLTKDAEPAPEPVADATGDPAPVEPTAPAPTEEPTPPLVVETPADEMARHAAERQAAEDAEAKATAEVALQLKAQTEARSKAEAMAEYERVQRALRRMGYAK